MRAFSLPFKPLTLFAVAGAACGAFAWHDSGHMAVAMIAYDGLTPQVKARVDALLKVGALPRSADFVTAACWADDAKSDKDREWHYINYFMDAGLNPLDRKPEPDANAVWAVLTQSEVMVDPQRPQSERANALRYLLHLVGDLHQPLHATARISEQTPGGDRGGNDYRILPPPGWDPAPRSLHFLWDMAGMLYPYYDRPLSAVDRKAFQQRVEQTRKRYPESAFGASTDVLDPEAWAKESFELARKEVYNTPFQAVPSKTYLGSVRNVSERQIALAGYRLARLLNQRLKLD
ncbi:MAG TPA: S1/P1 nuclease [Fimbriimonadaceae bacterium]|uniref:S1/P1 nuclease n=1 Tax=Candidatus Nitrosymbiomonas proteolyticus TaxID=2608984 RepID=A0A809R987_9BACT|nr:S1/P1 nuclease [Candidatus Nitrosymbiomonas proteolyticus]HQU18749.1 S1/P1 nuclease [Fimbriimonadaceae bacterium]